MLSMPSGFTLQNHVYILRSLIYPNRTYVGYSSNISQRLLDHNRGGSPYTAPYRPWKPEVIISFADKLTALEFERYLKSHSGKAFANKRFSSFPPHEKRPE